MGQGDGEGRAGAFPEMVSAQGRAAALAGAPPSTCPFRAIDSRARLLWLEGYLDALDAPDCPPAWRSYRGLVDMLRQGVVLARTAAAAGNVVVFCGASDARPHPRGRV